MVEKEFIITPIAEILTSQGKISKPISGTFGRRAALRLNLLIDLIF